MSAGSAWFLIGREGLGRPVLSELGKPLIHISDLGLSEEKNAVISVFHEIHHVGTATLNGTTSEAQAEAYGQRMYLKYVQNKK